MSTATFSTLPIEILYRIFDSVDIQTIIFSLRYVCKRLYLTSNSYDRYNFDFKSISKPNFRSICQLIPCENVISLVLSDEDKTRGQIAFFLSLYHIERFIRLQSLTLLEIEDVHLNVFLNYIVTSSLKSLSISTHILHVCQYTTPSLLSSAILHYGLQNLYLNICDHDWSTISWSMNRTVRYLRIVTSISLKQFSLILQHYCGLRTLILKEINRNDDGKEHISISSYQQLTSLTFEDAHIDMTRIEQCLLLTHSLTHLKIIGHGNLFNSSFDGFQWEKLIQTRLRSIKKFDFFLVILTNSNYHSRNIECLIQSFLTPFWLNEMHCFITCDYIPNSRKIMLYTLPVFKTDFVYHTDARKFPTVNFTTTSDHKNHNMDHVQKLELQLTKYVNTVSMETGELFNHFLFCNVTNLTLGNDGEWPKSTLQFLSTILDLSHLVELSLSINFLAKDTPNTIANINKLLNQASNLRSLLLYDYWAPDNPMTRMETICSMISSNIRHLQIRVKNIDDIKYILEQLKQLTSVTFEYAQILTINRQDFIHSLAYLNRVVSSWESQCAIHVWLGNQKSTD